MALSSKDVQQEAYYARLLLDTYYSECTVLNKLEIFGFALDHLYELFEPGDSAYALREYLLTPYLNPATPQEQCYNTAHISTRNVVEGTFGILKSRFWILHKTGGALLYDPVTCCRIIAVCAMLHNIATRRGIPIEVDGDDGFRAQQPPPNTNRHTCLTQQKVKGSGHTSHNITSETGGIKGKVLFSLAFGPTLLQVLPACEHFEEIYLATSSEADVAEYQKWLRNEADAFDWTPLMKKLCILEGDVEKHTEKERVLRATIKQCLTFDMTKSNPFHPVVLPAADCVILYFLLAPLGKDKETCIEYLRKVAAQIKDGGHLVIYAALGMSYFRLGQQRVSCFSYDQQFVEKALDEVGYEIHDFSCRDREDPSNTSYCDYKKTAVFAAKKKGSL